MIESCRKIGICGGTFDPIHHGHLVLAQEVQERFGLDRVLFIPTGTPPHKITSKVSDSVHRLTMVEIAVRSNDFFEACSIEVDRKGYTYTVDTLIELRKKYKENVNLYFITGADVISELVMWKDFRKVFTLCEFIAAFRPGMIEKDFYTQIEDLNQRYGAKIHPVEIPLIQISSTVIREKIQSGKSVKYLVPDCVEKYLLENGLYKE